MSTAETNDTWDHIYFTVVRRRNWRRKKLEELEEMENFAFCHDDSWGNEYAMPNINWEQHRDAIEKIKKELVDGPPPAYPADHVLLNFQKS